VKSAFANADLSHRPVPPILYIACAVTLTIRKMKGGFNCRRGYDDDVFVVAVVIVIWKCAGKMCNIFEKRGRERERERERERTRERVYLRKEEGAEEKKKEKEREKGKEREGERVI